MKCWSAAWLSVCIAVRLWSWEITDVKLRCDFYPLDPQEFQWVEGWGEPDQFFPRYFEPAGTVQLLLRNDGTQANSAGDILWKGRPVGETVTRPDFAGEVIWYRLTPETVAPGETAQLTLRLRSLRALPAEIAVDGGDCVVDREDGEALRILYVGFNAARDRLTLFVDGPEGTECEALSVDGENVPISIDHGAFGGGNPAVIQAALPEALPYGRHIVLRVRAGSLETFEQLRVRDDFFPLGIIGGNTDMYLEAGFNFNYVLHGGGALAEIAGMARLSPVDEAAALEHIAATRPGNRYFYGNTDEPDAHEPYGLPYMERCGVNAMLLVEPLMALQRRHDPVHLTALMIDRTYAPMNWYVYGQLPDIPFNDCYVPTIFHGYDSELVSKTASVLLAATAPRPPQMMLWTALNTAHSPRVTTPLENEVQYTYALASGLKGVHYFIDWSSYPTRSEGGYYVGASRIPALWRSMARGNAVADRLAPLLNLAYPWQGVTKSSTDQLWTGTLLAEGRHLVIGAVNRCIRVNELDKMHFVHTRPLRDAAITVTLPEAFDQIQVRRVTAEGVTPVVCDREGRRLTIPLPELNGGTFFVISTDPEIDDLLAGTPEVQARIARLLQLPALVSGEPIAAREWTERSVTLPPEGLTLDFRDPAVLESAAMITVTNAILERDADGLIALRPGPAEREAIAELVFLVETPAESLTAELRGRTLSLGYLAALEIAAAPTATDAPRVAASRRPEWESGSGEAEALTVAVTPAEGKAVIRVRLRDPLIVRPDQYSAALVSLRLMPSAAGS